MWTSLVADSWFGRIPHVAEQLNLCTTIEPLPQSPGAATAEVCAPQSSCYTRRDTTAMRNACTTTREQPLYSPQLEKSPCSNKDSAQPKIKKQIKNFFKNPQFYAYKFCESEIQVWLSSGFLMSMQSRYWLELRLSENLTGTAVSNYKIDLALVGSHPQAARVSSQDGSWLPPEWVIQEGSKAPNLVSIQGVGNQTAHSEEEACQRICEHSSKPPQEVRRQGHRNAERQVPDSIQRAFNP